jgi:Mg2+ and Co2+ transporter CorA
MWRGEFIKSIAEVIKDFQKDHVNKQLSDAEIRELAARIQEHIEEMQDNNEFWLQSGWC